MESYISPNTHSSEVEKLCSRIVAPGPGVGASGGTLLEMQHPGLYRTRWGGGSVLFSQALWWGTRLRTTVLGPSEHMVWSPTLYPKCSQVFNIQNKMSTNAFGLWNSTAIRSLDQWTPSLVSEATNGCPGPSFPRLCRSQTSLGGPGPPRMFLGILRSSY